MRNFVGITFSKSPLGPLIQDFCDFSSSYFCLAFAKRLYNSTSTWSWCSRRIRASRASFSLWCFLSLSMHYMKSFYLPRRDYLLTKHCVLYFPSRIVYIPRGSLFSRIRYIYLLPSMGRPFISLVHEASA